MEQSTVSRNPAYSETTRGISVTVVPSFSESASDIENATYVHSYDVTIVNQGVESVQLINRHWIVSSGGRQIADVKGEGVIGEQPLLGPGVTFRYSSWTVVNDPIGWMEGTYTFRSESGEFFDTIIPRFDLIYFDSKDIH